MKSFVMGLVKEITGRAILIGVIAAATVIFLVLASTADGQEAPTAVRGSVIDTAQVQGHLWSYTGTFSPTERNNVLSNIYAEQTMSIFARGSVSVTPYAAIGISMDTQGNPWNRSIQPVFGVKANKFFRYGMVSGGTAESYQDRFGTTSGHGGTNYILDWFGWGFIGDPHSRFPGSTWGIVGHTVPVEHGNLIAQMYVQQGYIARRFGKTALIPYGEVTYSRDSKHLEWENKTLEGVGVKYVRPLGEMYVDVGTGMMHETRFISHQSGMGLKVFMDVSYSWTGVFGRWFR